MQEQDGNLPSPENSAMKRLPYARVILNSATPAASFTRGGR